nr:MAG TPA: restriction alleviation protein [Caudoviricetes sp.]
MTENKTELKPCPFCGSNRVCRHYMMRQNRIVPRVFIRHAEA